MRGSTALINGWTAARIDGSVAILKWLPTVSGSWPHFTPLINTIADCSEVGIVPRWSVDRLPRKESAASRGQVTEGTRLLDEAMASATGGELGMMATGIVYCRMMCACLDLHDFRRAGEWTDVVGRCRATSGLGGFPGDCRTHRAAFLIRRGAWAEAEEEALRAVEGLRAFNLPHMGVASYARGEVHLRQGDLEGAEEAFLRAHELGFMPEPGMSLIRLARTNVVAGMSSIEAALADATLDRLARSRLLPAQIEIALAAADTETAGRAVAELEEIAAVYGTAALRAAAQYARGRLELEKGAATEAIRRLGAAQRLWREAQDPYEAARAQALLAEAHLALGDREVAC